MREFLRTASLGLAIVAGLAASQVTHAATILSFGQSGGGSPVVATNPTASTTAINAIDVPITITSILGAAVPVSAYFTLHAISDAAATALAGVGYLQPFSGSFAITSAAGGAGQNFLSGSFTDITGALDSSATLRSSTPSQSVFFTSSVIAAGLLSDPKALALSFADLLPPATALCGTAPDTTLCGFSASVSGVFSASAVAVPEPASILLAGGGLMAFGLVRRRRRA